MAATPYSPKDPNRAPLGDSIRDMINPALEDRRCHQLMLDQISGFFDSLAAILPQALEEGYATLFNRIVRARAQEQKNEMVIRAIAFRDPATGKTEYSPEVVEMIPVATDYTNFSADEIRELPGYIRLHEVARDENIAINLQGLIGKDGEKTGGRAIVIIDAMKSYNDGVIEHYAIYPHLPPKKEKFNPRTAEGLDL